MENLGTGWIRSISGLLLLWTVGCSNRAVSEPATSPATSSSEVQPTRIEQLQPPQLQSTVQVAGKVVDRVPVLNGTVYQLQDSTGKVWILTKTSPPNVGDEISVTGTVRYKSIPLNGKEQGSLYIEQK